MGVGGRAGLKVGGPSAGRRPPWGPVPPPPPVAALPVGHEAESDTSSPADALTEDWCETASTSYKTTLAMVVIDSLSVETPVLGCLIDRHRRCPARGSRLDRDRARPAVVVTR